MVGIGITTFNRKGMLCRCIERVRRHTNAPFILFVADDGSEDGTTEILAESGVTYVSPSNRGIAWNKNRALFYLHEVARCEYIILLEDDTYPNKDGWEQDWIEAIKLYGHVNLYPSHWKVNCEGGTGTPADPFLGKSLTGQCTGFSREAMTLVGYLDTRFRHYGFEHVEHTERFMRAGFGGDYTEPKGFLPYLISSHLRVEGLDKAPDEDGIRQNIPIYKQLQGQQIHRQAWRGDEELFIFRSELVAINEWTTASKPPSAPIAFLQSNDSQNLWFSGGNIVAESSLQGALQVALTLHGRTARLCLCNDTSRPISGWLTVDPIKAVWSIVDEVSAASFEIIHRKTSGFGLRAFRMFLCCDHAIGSTITLSRATLSDWETFRISEYSNNLRA